MKSLHIYFPDKSVVVNVNNNDPVIKIWTTSKKLRKLIGAQTYQKAYEIAVRTDRSVGRYILYKVRKRFRLIPK